MSTPTDTLFAQNLKVSCAAYTLTSAQRQEIGVHAIRGNTPIKHLKDVLAVYQLKGQPFSSQKRWQQEAALRAYLCQKFYWIKSSVAEVLNNTFRANSLVENINSRLRTYFTLRRELGNEYLDFLQFFLNHRRFMRSKYAERLNKSPTELMTGQTHAHWLEMLGFELFEQAA